MDVRVCLECSTAYAAALQACPQCGAASRAVTYRWHNDVVTQAGTYYMPEGGTVPEDLPDRIQLAGPGAPKRPAARSRR